MTAVGRLGDLTLTRRIGAGGEADVFEVEERPGLVCKRYRKPTPARAAKLAVMVASPPGGTTSGGHVSIAWPTEAVLDERGDVVGFLMPRIDVHAAVPVFQVYNPASRLRVAPGFTWRYLLRTARNVAAIVDSVHRAGYVIGDLNESNLLVDRRALVSLVDCDSMQVTDTTRGTVHHSPVGKPEFLAPELHGRDLAATERTRASDAFALTVLIVLLLLEGVHPYSGVWRGRGDPPDLASRVRKGWASHRRWSPVDPPPHAVALRVLPADVRELVHRGLSSRPARRPAAWEWVAALEGLDRRLRACKRSPHHLFASRLGRCPWCARIDRGLPDPFPGPSGRSDLSPRLPPWWRRVATRLRGLQRPSTAVPRRLAAFAPVGFAAAAWRWPIAALAAVVIVMVPAARAWSSRGTPQRRVPGRRLSPLRAARVAGRLGRRFGVELKESVIALATTLSTAGGMAYAAVDLTGVDDWRVVGRIAVALTAAVHGAYRRHA